MFRDLASDYDEPTVVPSGCEPADRGESCGKTDCPSCGREAAAQLRADAITGTAGIIALAREINRIDEGWGANVPEHAVTRGDLVRLRDPRLGPVAFAWAEGIIEALLPAGDAMGIMYKDPAEQAAHAAGWRLVDVWQRQQCESPVPGKPWITPDEFTPCTAAEKARRLGIPSAAGDLSPHRRPTAQPSQRAESGPGLNSRAQHNRGVR